MHTDPTACHAALTARDPAADGLFFTCVTSTGIFCRPICPARTPLLKNCRFVATVADALAAGFRACKRCRPDAAPGSAAWLGTAASVRRALALIEHGGLDEASSVDALGDRLGLGERQVRRLFAKHLGAPPVAVAQAKRLATATALIDEGRMPLAEVALTAGFGSVRRFNELFRDVHGETPAARRSRARKGTPMNLVLSRYTASAHGLGADLLIVTDDNGAVRALDFADYESRMRTLLARHYGPVDLIDGPLPPPVAAALDAYLDGDLTALDALPVATSGSAFQRKVWAALRAIPPGTTTGYGALATAIGSPGAARAVGLANGSNPIGIIVPCHRVIGGSGALTGYAGGVERKKWLLEHERAFG